MSTICRGFYTAYRAHTAPAVLEFFKRAGVLGDSRTGYTVELEDGEQIEVGRQCCKYCARTDALGQLAARFDKLKPSTIKGVKLKQERPGEWSYSHPGFPGTRACEWRVSLVGLRHYEVKGNGVLQFQTSTLHDVRAGIAARYKYLP